MDEILFEVTEKNLETGMRGYPVGFCVTSSVDPKTGLHYCGKPLSQIASWKPEEVIYLLYYGKQGNAEEVKTFFAKIGKVSHLSEKVVQQIYQLPREGHPMKLFSVALLLLEIHEKTGNYELDCLQVIGKLPHLVACVINHHAGWGETPLPDLSKGYMEAFTEMIQLPEKHPTLGEVFKLFNVLHYDHGGGNLSAFVGKAVASGLEGLLGALSAAMCALAGPRHGSANQETLEFVKDVSETLGSSPNSKQISDLIEKRLANKELVPGFGHAVLRVEDPRATLEYAFAKKHYPDHPLVKVALLLREEVPKILKENPKITNPYPNVDAVSGTLLSAAGFAYPEYYTVLFGLSRCIGIAIQILYERKFAREGKGTPITRPKYFYKSR